ncbi:proteasome assembly chaperone 3-like [Tachypleus tridentatus]|uniref:proteasome assembly chaperone 3-like n=1 Tax=Tachypleus tridentatus TaxID=6853 RepID=UPI003FD17861
MATAVSGSCNVTPNMQLKAITEADLIGNIFTDFSITCFENCIFVVITQFGKLGTLVHITKDVPQEVSCNTEDRAVFSTKVIFGNDEPYVHAAARYLVSLMETSKTVLLAIALKNWDRDTVVTIGNRAKQIFYKALVGV